MYLSTPLTRRALIALSACCLSLIPALSSAATLTVTNTNGDNSAGSLRKAIEDAGTIGGADMIIFDADLSGETIRLDGTELAVDSDLTIDASALPDGITISGDKTGNGPTVDDSRVFYISGGADVTLISLTITEGRASDAVFGNDGANGGGIYILSGTVRLQGCNVVYNSTGDGGEYNSDDAGGGGYGGGIYAGGGTLTLEQCTVAHNRCGDGGSMTGSGSFDYAGAGGNGGGISSSGTLILRQCTIAHNRCGDGGSAASGSNAGRGGRGSGISYSGTVTVEQCTITHNRAGDGGDVVSGGTGGDGGGGGIFAFSGPSTLTDSIVAGNIGGLGGNGGISGDDGNWPDLRDDSSITTIGINLIGDNTLQSGSPSTVFPAGPFVGTGAAPLDALLGTLADNGGPTETLIPLRGSPALNPSGGAAASTFPTDQRGFTRIVAGIMDIGAVEAPDYAAIDAQIANAASAKAAQQADLSRKLKKLKKKAKNAKRKGHKAKAKKYKKQIKKMLAQIRAL